MTPVRTAILVSGRGSNMVSLLEAARDDSAFPAAFSLVVSNRPGVLALERAAAFGVPTDVIDHKTFADRESFDRALSARLEAAGIELICLAGFMRLLTPWLVEHWRDRMLNIHPAILPAFKGLHTHERALEAGVKLHGCTVHLVRSEMDAGPIIAQAAVPVLSGDTPDSLGARVLGAEHRLYPHALRLWASGRAKLEGERVFVDGEAGAAAALIAPGL